MNILQNLLLVAILSFSWFFPTPQTATNAPTIAEMTYAKCQEVERYYLAEVQEALPQVSDPNSISQPIVARGEGFFWNQPNDVVFIPFSEDNPISVAGIAKEGSYLSPQKVTCDLARGKIAIDMKSFIFLADKSEPVVIEQVDEMQWDKNAGIFKGQIVFLTQDKTPYLQLDSDFLFRGCNTEGVDCESIDILLSFTLPKELSCQDFAKNTYGLNLRFPNQIESCATYTNNLNYFWDNPEEVVVFEKGDRQISGSHLQVVNNVTVETTYRDKRVFEYQGVSCFMQYTSNARQDWENRDFDTNLCSPRKIVQTRR